MITMTCRDIADYEMDNTSDTNMNALISGANRHLTSQGGQKRIEQLAELLKE